MTECSEPGDAAKQLSQDVDAFLDSLPAGDFSVGPAERLKVHHALLLLALRGPLPDLSRVRWIVGPIVCRGAFEQERFGQQFDDWMQHRAPAAAAEPAAAKDVLPSILERSSRSRAIWLGIAALLLTIALGSMGWIWTLRHGGSASRNTPAVAPTPIPAAAAETETRSYSIGALAAAGTMLLATMLFFGFRRRQARLFLVQRKTAVQNKPVSVEVEAGTVFDRIALASAAQSLGRYRLVESAELHPERTAVRTAENAGFFVPVPASRPAVPEYLVLIDRADPGDQHSAYADRLSTELERNNLALERFYFDGDPRLCYPASDPTHPVVLGDLAASHATHRLLLFSDGSGLFHERSGLAAPWLDLFQIWSERVLLTPVPQSNWSYRESVLEEQGWLLLPPFAESLANFAAALHNEPSPTRQSSYRGRYPEALEWDEAKWIDPARQPWEEIDRLLVSLRAYLGDSGFDWLAACAIYPAVDWNLTLYLGEQLQTGGNAVLNGDLLMALIRLPWFRQGSMPGWLRQALVAAMSKAAEQQAREALQHLLVAEPSATGKFTLSIAPELKPQLTRFAADLIRQLRKTEPAGGPLHDQVYATFMSGRNPAPLALPVPERVARLLGVRRGNFMDMIRPQSDLAKAAALIALVIGIQFSNHGGSYQECDPLTFAIVLVLMWTVAARGFVMKTGAAIGAVAAIIGLAGDPRSAGYWSAIADSVATPAIVWELAVLLRGNPSLLAAALSSTFVFNWHSSQAAQVLPRSTLIAAIVSTLWVLAAYPAKIAWRGLLKPRIFLVIGAGAILSGVGWGVLETSLGIEAIDNRYGNPLSIGAEALLLVFLLRPRLGRPVRQFLAVFGFVAALTLSAQFLKFTDIGPVLLAFGLMVIAANGVRRPLKIPAAWLLACACLSCAVGLLIPWRPLAWVATELAITTGICFMVDSVPSELAALAFYAVQAGWYAAFSIVRYRERFIPFRLWAAAGMVGLFLVALASRRLFEPERRAPVRPAPHLPQTAYSTAAAGCYALGPITGVLMLAVPRFRDDRTVRFHAWQSILFSAFYMVFAFTFAVLRGVLMAATATLASSLLAWIQPLLSLVLFATWLLLIVQTSRNRPVLLPWIGRWALRLAGSSAPGRETQAA